jgi:DNA mismatch repair protein MutS
MAVTKSYFSLLNENKTKYGDNTFLLMQVGSFFEVYCTAERDPHMLLFSQLCDLKIANKGVITDIGVVYMAGFRDYMLEKYLSKLNESSYTIVVYIQEEINGIIERRQDAVYSPGTLFVDDEVKISNNVTCIWIHKTKKDIIFGLSNLDIYTGRPNVCEYQQLYYHNPTTYDNIEKFISIYRPIELIFIHNLDDAQLDTIIQYIKSNSRKTTRISLNDDNTFTNQAINCENQLYQNETIHKFYPHLTQTQFITDLFEKTIAFQSLCFLLNYVSQHNPSLTTLLREPTIEKQDNLILANHSLKQLNFIEGEYKGEYSSVLKLLNKCKTKIGQREMEHVLLNPIKHIGKLNQSYDMIEHALSHKYSWAKLLSTMCDVEKYIRKSILSRASPSDYADIYDTCNLLKEIISSHKNDATILQYINADQVMHEISHFQTFCETCFNIDSCKQVSSINFDKFPEISHTFIKRGYNITLDNSIRDKFESIDKLNSIVAYLNNLYKTIDKKTTEVIKMHETSITQLLITKRRKSILNQCILGMPNKKINITFHSTYTDRDETFVFDLSKIVYKDYNNTNDYVESVEINELTTLLYTTNNSFYKELQDCYSKIHPIISVFSYNAIIFCIQQLDTLNTKCEVANAYNYSKPIIQEFHKSFVNIKKLRHALIEHLDKNELYVTNDIDLGVDPQGMLLFGTNAVGKTSLIKSLGICIIMAQAGFYVPCESMTYFPYEYIFTRIIGNDNIFKGLSTFGVEMSELRVILNNCNKNSLILGDELCSGTEIDSALSIFTAGLEKMYACGSTFIFATHFHEIQYYEEITRMNKLALKHLTVQYNHELDKLVYNRILMDGAGDSIYGLEVCKSLQMPAEFLTRAYNIRDQYDKRKTNILNLKITKHNKNKLKGMCEFCNNILGSEIHHLQYQCNSNSREYIDSFHKDHPANLASICEKCHQHIHALGLIYEKKKTINGYIIILK